MLRAGVNVHGRGRGVMREGHGRDEIIEKRADQARDDGHPLADASGGGDDSGRGTSSLGGSEGLGTCEFIHGADSDCHSRLAPLGLKKNSQITCACREGARGRQA